jgi:hypothetical protein
VKALRLRLDLAIQPLHPRLVRIEPREQRGPRRAAARAIVELRKARGTFCIGQEVAMSPGHGRAAGVSTCPLALSRADM